MIRTCKTDAGFDLTRVCCKMFWERKWDDWRSSDCLTKRGKRQPQGVHMMSAQLAVNLSRKEAGGRSTGHSVRSSLSITYCSAYFCILRNFDSKRHRTDSVPDSPLRQSQDLSRDDTVISRKLVLSYANTESL